MEYLRDDKQELAAPPSLAVLYWKPLAFAAWAFAMALAVGSLYLTTQAKTSTESALSAVLLTCISVLLSWILAHYYATATRRQEIEQINEAHEKSLRMYALKAAEKVMNFLESWTSFLHISAYRDAEEDGSLPLLLRSKDERITGAIHIVSMLRSVNDTALSDWEGVIGAELDKKREEEKEERRSISATLLQRSIRSSNPYVRWGRLVQPPRK